MLPIRLRCAIVKAGKSRGALVFADAPCAYISSPRQCSTIAVKVFGNNIPAPAQTFHDIPFNDAVATNISQLGYRQPTDVQQYAIPVLLAKRDLMACAQTGSGKTIAFLAPIFHHVLESGAKENSMKEKGTIGNIECHPSALVLAPTRELTRQIYEESVRMARSCAIHTAILHGGSENYRYQLNMLRGGGDIIVATPGRLNDLIRQNIVCLKHCRHLVLDEADRMLDMGFEPQIRQIIQHSGLPAAKDRHTSMFSATFPSEIRQLASEFMKADYAYLSIGHTGTIPKSISQKLIWTLENEKPNALVKLLDEEPNVLKLVFVETKLTANSLTELLNIKTKHRAVTVHGNLSQRMRERNLSLFREGRISTLIATSVAARGLDIPNVKHVINYDLPTNIDDYIHRIGRTGRMGNQGFATSFCNEANASIFQDLRRVLKETGHEAPEFLNRAFQIAADRSKKRRSKFTWNDRQFKRASESFTVNAMNFS
uniref:RNA helicase n=1 Tax=Trichuris muris TaxID=70415 RepID=A0A5S6QXG4_TRIMR